MQKPRGLDRILLDKIKDNIKGSFEKIKDKANKSIKYLDERLEYIGDKTYYGFRKFKDEISEYRPMITSAITMALPPYAKASILAGSYIENLYKGPGGKLLKYVLMVSGIGIPIGLGILLLHPIHPLPSSNHVEYVGPGYIAFEPNGQTIYNGHPDPKGYLIFNNGTIIHNVIWNGQYANTIIQDHNQIVQLNNQFVGQTDPINNQPYKPLQDVYVIDANNRQVPIQQAIINGQTYYVIEANNINQANIAGFYTYQGWVTNFVEAMNTPGTIPERLPGNSPVFTWDNLTGTVAYQTLQYKALIGSIGGGYVLELPNGTIISYGVTTSPIGTSFSNFIIPQQVYNESG